jgi:hypothetical protein
MSLTAYCNQGCRPRCPGALSLASSIKGFSHFNDVLFSDVGLDLVVFIKDACCVI